MDEDCNLLLSWLEHLFSFRIEVWRTLENMRQVELGLEGPSLLLIVGKPLAYFEMVAVFLVVLMNSLRV